MLRLPVALVRVRILGTNAECGLRNAECEVLDAKSSDGGTGGRSTGTLLTPHSSLLRQTQQRSGHQADDHFIGQAADG